MAEATIVEVTVAETIKSYLARLPRYGIHARRAILFGSQATGTADQWSDIDLIVLAPEFDGEYPYELRRQLWIARPDEGAPVQPIACGEREWEVDDGRPILEIARREGIEISL